MNWEKCVITLQQRLEFLGLMVDSGGMGGGEVSSCPNPKIPVSQTTSPSDWADNGVHPSRATSSPTLQSSPEAEVKSPRSYKDCTWQPSTFVGCSTSGFTVVDQEPSTTCKSTNYATSTCTDSVNWCIKGRLGSDSGNCCIKGRLGSSVLQRQDLHRGTLDQKNSSQSTSTGWS